MRVSGVASLFRSVVVVRRCLKVGLAHQVVSVSMSVMRLAEKTCAVAVTGALGSQDALKLQSVFAICLFVFRRLCPSSHKIARMSLTSPCFQGASHTCDR